MEGHGSAWKGVEGVRTERLEGVEIEARAARRLELDGPRVEHAATWHDARGRDEQSAARVGNRVEGACETVAGAFGASAWVCEVRCGARARGV